jgi:hypothetical protein
MYAKMSIEIKYTGVVAAPVTPPIYIERKQVYNPARIIELFQRNNDNDRRLAFMTLAQTLYYVNDFPFDDIILFLNNGMEHFADWVFWNKINYLSEFDPDKILELYRRGLHLEASRMFRQTYELCKTFDKNLILLFYTSGMELQAVHMIWSTLKHVNPNNIDEVISIATSFCEHANGDADLDLFNNFSSVIYLLSNVNKLKIYLLFTSSLERIQHYQHREDVETAVWNAIIGDIDDAFDSEFVTLMANQNYWYHPKLFEYFVAWCARQTIFSAKLTHEIWAAIEVIPERFRKDYIRVYYNATLSKKSDKEFDEAMKSLPYVEYFNP